MDLLPHSNQPTRMPLYGQVREGIRDLLKARKPGDRVGTEAEFVKQFGVSVVTVRRALSELAQEGLIERRQGSGTFVPELSQKGKHVAVLLDVDVASGQISSAYFKIVQAVRRSLTELGIPNRPYLGQLPLGVEPTGLTCEDFLDDVQLGRIRGLVGFFIKRNPSWTEQLAEKHIPIIDAEFFRKEDIEQKLHMMESVLAYFHHRRRTHIAVMGWESQRDGFSPFTEAFVQLAPKYGIRVDRRLLDLDANGWEQGNGWERFRDLWTASSDRPDGLFLADDMIFPDCQRAILEMQIPIPKMLDIVVRSSDAIDLNPKFPIYVLKLKTEDYGRIYALAMKALIEGTKLPSLKDAPFVGEMQGDFSGPDVPDFQVSPELTTTPQ